LGIAGLGFAGFAAAPPAGTVEVDFSAPDPWSDGGFVWVEEAWAEPAL